MSTASEASREQLTDAQLEILDMVRKLVLTLTNSDRFTHDESDQLLQVLLDS